MAIKTNTNELGATQTELIENLKSKFNFIMLPEAFQRQNQNASYFSREKAHGEDPSIFVQRRFDL